MIFWLVKLTLHKITHLTLHYSAGQLFTINLLKLNKDHQRMMVDPMFIIVKSLRSFLTAVITNAVAPIAVVLPVFT